jgi:hypothetical protein
MRTTTAIVACMLLTSCGIFTADQVQGIVEVIDTIQQQGGLTPMQAEALRTAVMANTGEPWYLQVGRVVLEVGLAVAGVRWWRGPAAPAAERVARIAAKAKIDRA